jgi:hypothetical protein
LRFVEACRLIVACALAAACSLELAPIASDGTGGGCYGGCNPITNDCQPGSVCDWDTSSGAYELVCWPTGNFTAPLCAPCDNKNGPWCQPGLSCVGNAATTGRCAKYCCTDADCGGAPGSCTRWGDTALFFCAT